MSERKRKREREEKRKKLVQARLFRPQHVAWRAFFQTKKQPTLKEGAFKTTLYTTNNHKRNFRVMQDGTITTNTPLPAHPTLNVKKRAKTQNQR